MKQRNGGTMKFYVLTNDIAIRRQRLGVKLNWELNVSVKFTKFSSYTTIFQSLIFSHLHSAHFLRAVERRRGGYSTVVCNFIFQLRITLYWLADLNYHMCKNMSGIQIHANAINEINVLVMAFAHCLLQNDYFRVLFFSTMCLVMS